MTEVPSHTQRPVWERSLLRYGLVALVIIKVAGLVLLFDWTAKSLNPFDLVKSAWSRSIEWLIAALLLMALFRFGLQLVPRTRIHAAVIAVVLSTAVASVFAEDKYVALFGTQGRYLGLVWVIDMAVLYLAVAVAFRTTRDWIILGLTIAAAALLSGAYAWIQFAGLDPLPWTASSAVRPFATIGNPNTYGHLLSVILGAIAGIAVLYEGRGRMLIRLISGAFAFAVLVTAGIVATRGTVLGIASAFLILPPLFLLVHGRTTRNVMLAAGGVCLAAVLVGVTLALSPLGARLMTTLQLIATRDRLLIYEAALRMIEERPVFGYGPDGFGVAWATVRPPEMAALVGLYVNNNSAHDWLLQAGATTGFVGLGALLALLFFSIAALLTGLRSAPLLAAILLLGSAGYWMHALVSVGTAGVDWVPWVVAGAAANITTAHGIGTKEQRALNPVVSTILMVLAIGLSLIPWRAVEADRRALEARFASNGGQGSAAIARAEAAISLDDGRADYWNELGRALFVGSRWHEAADAFRTSVARAPYDATYRINLARALTQMARAGDSSMGGKSAALAAALEAVESDPNEPTIRGAQAEIANALGEHEIALRAAVSAIRLYPREPSYDSLAALAASQLSDTSLVRQLVGQALGYKDSAILRVVVAQAALRQGDRPAALENARQALRLDPSSQDAKAIIAAAGG